MTRAFLTHPQPGGFKTYTVNLLSALAELDAENEYIIYLDRPPTPDTPLPQSDRFHYSVVDGSLPGLGMILREQVGLRRRMSRDRLDLVHFLCNTACVNLNRKYVVTLHDTIQVTTATPFTLGRTLAEQKNWAVKAYSARNILHSVDGAATVITVSHYEREQISRALSIPQSRIAVTHLAANPVFQRASEAQRRGWREELSHELGIHGRYIMGVGYETRKNIPLLMEAFAQIAPDFADLSLVLVVAQKAQADSFRTYAQELGVGARTVVLGQTPAARLARLYNVATLFVYPSTRESFGLPPLEAMACGLPTMAMHASSIPEVVEDGALLVASTDAVEWAGALRTLLTDECLYADLRRRGLARASRLSWRTCAEETVAVYAGVLNPSPGIELSHSYPANIAASSPRIGY
ncbi:MAG: glycosyltransferase family 1 protein [Caldilineaceae bacterium]